MNKTKAAHIIEDRVERGLSIRTLALKYGTPASSIYRLVKKHKPIAAKPAKDDLPNEVAELKALLRRERLKNELLNNIIDIADKELGINIRKKSGTERSE